MKRREFLRMGTLGLVGAAGGYGLLEWTPRAHAATVTRTFYVTEGFIRQPTGVDVYFRGFSSSGTVLDVPAKPITAQEGDTIVINIYNNLGTAHSFVIDGVVDSGTIAAGTFKSVQFTAPKAGTYMFYDKLNAPYNRLVGLHGGLAVMPAGVSDQLYVGSPKFKKQLFWIFNEIDPVWHGRVRDRLTPTTDFKPYYFTINGLSQRPPGAAGYGDPNVDAGYNPDTALKGMIGDRTLIRVLNAGMCSHSIHWHANHVEWLTQNGAVRSAIWKKDTVPIDNNMGRVDVIFPFVAPPDAYPPVTKGHYVMHLHDEMTQTAGGGLYQFGAATAIRFM
ncbi:MAG: multicopper oxidase domain-containing protein [Gammaproteobacteria bacterium]